jgi:gluconolactonase
MTLQAEIIANDLPFGEGPVWCPDGTLVLTRIATAALRRLWPESGKSEVIATLDGGANAAQLADDGGFVFTNNGGINFSAIWTPAQKEIVEVPAFVPSRPGIQRLRPDGVVEAVTTQDVYSAPNDLVVARDGTLYFTDPPRLQDGLSAGGGPELGSVWAKPVGQEPKVIATGFTFCNGIALSPDGRLLIIEKDGLLWLDADGQHEWFVESLPEGLAGDGFCFDVEGRVYVASPHGGFLHVIESDGHVVDRLEMGSESSPTNCCFGGQDGRTLFVVEIFPGRVHAVEGLPSPGLPQVPWPVPETPDAHDSPDEGKHK